jgi:diacylglycerol kinase (ATP)
MRRGDVGPVERLISASGNSWSGLVAAWRTQQALRYELYVLLVVVPSGWWLGKDGVERALMIGSAFLVVVVELLNSAIETAIDRIGEGYHELSGRAKDMGSAAVLCSILLAVMVWLIILIHK